jgi:hypothetical protein
MIQLQGHCGRAPGGQGQLVWPSPLAYAAGRSLFGGPGGSAPGVLLGLAPACICITMRLSVGGMTSVVHSVGRGGGHILSLWEGVPPWATQTQIGLLHLPAERTLAYWPHQQADCIV